MVAARTAGRVGGWARGATSRLIVSGAGSTSLAGSATRRSTGAGITSVSAVWVAGRVTQVGGRAR
jgi:hypothetical protein